MGRGYLEGDMKEWWDNSMQCIEKAQQLNDNDFEVHRMLAEVALSTHDFKAGERHARTSFKMVPNDPEYYRCMEKYFLELVQQKRE